MTDKFVCPEPSQEAEAAFHNEPGSVRPGLRAAYAVDVPAIVRAEVEKALREAQYIDTYLAARFGESERREPASVRTMSMYEYEVERRMLQLDEPAPLDPGGATPDRGIGMVTPGTSFDERCPSVVDGKRCALIPGHKTDHLHCLGKDCACAVVHLGPCPSDRVPPPFAPPDHLPWYGPETEALLVDLANDRHDLASARAFLASREGK